MATKDHHTGEIISWIWAHVFTTSVLAFSIDLVKAFALGFVGGFAGMIARIIFKKFFNNEKGKSN